jgi:hypothetical protein
MPGSHRTWGSRRKGKIARSEWPRIAARRASGESQAAIARDYGCSPPNIRYIVKRQKAAGSVEPGQRAAPRPPSEAISGGDVFPDLGDRFASEMASLIVALDGASAGSRDALSRLREATDGVMLCAARVLIEIERVERAAGSVERGAPEL